MDYMVLAHDGKEYGPASVATLKQWVAENRLEPASRLRDFQTGQIVLASSVQEVFPTAVPAATATATMPPPAGQPGPWSNPPSPYTRAPMPYGGVYTGSSNSGAGDIWGSIFRSVLAIVFFFFRPGIGLFFAGYGVYYAIRAQSNGHKYAWVAILISSITLIAIVLGWVVRLS